MISKALYSYLSGTTLYGFVRKIDEMVHATILVREYDKELQKHVDRPVPMLTTQKATVLGLSAIASPYLWPKYLYDDLTWFEMGVRGVNPYDYGYRRRRSMLDYLF